MDSLQDLLGAKKRDEPPEVAIIKKFLFENFQASCQVEIKPRQIVIAVNSSPLAGALRMRLHELQKQIDSPKRLMIQIR